LISFELEKLKILLPPDDALVKDIEDFQYHLDQDYSLFLTSGFLNRLIELFKNIHQSHDKFLDKGRGRSSIAMLGKQDTREVVQGRIEE
jgi:hypothetical protein